MATFDFFAPVNMLTTGPSTSSDYGYITQATSGWIQVTGSYWQDDYFGYDFTYSGDTVTGGVLTDLYTSVYGEMMIAVNGMRVSAAAVAQYNAQSDIAGMFSVMAGGNDVITAYGDGNDVLHAWAGNDTVYSYGGNDTVYGGTGNDRLNGMDGNDVMNGGTGADVMAGSIGNDRMYIDNAGDQVLESANQGFDRVHTSISFTLAAGQHVEAINTTNQVGTAALKLTGNEIAQTITGNNGANIISGAGGNDIISGAAGNDVIYGNAGNDRLTGGAGYDHFIFDGRLNAASNVDTITDFNPAQDAIRLQNAVMTGLGAHLGTLSSAMFWKSTTGLAHDSNDRITYETDTGKLFYDSNGSAAGGSVQIAKLAPNLALTYADFFVI